MQIVDLSGLYYAISGQASTTKPGTVNGYNFQGNVSNLLELPTTGNRVGDHYTIGEYSYVWNGVTWDKFKTDNIGNYMTEDESDAKITEVVNNIKTYAAPVYDQESEAISFD